MAISFSFITALAPKIEYRFWWILAVGWIALAVCIILNILSYLKAKRNCRTNIQNIDNYLWGKYNTDNDQERYDDKDLVVNGVSPYFRILIRHLKS